MILSDFVECGLFLESSVDIYEKNLKLLLKQKEKKAENPNMEKVGLFVSQREVTWASSGQSYPSQEIWGAPNLPEKSSTAEIPKRF